MEIATGAIRKLLPKLGDLLKEEYKLQKSVRGEIMFLKAELEAMQTVLLKISSAPMDEQPDAQVNLWVREVRELSYDLEDNIDRFLVRIDHEPEQLHGLRGFIDRSLKLLTKANLRRQIGTDINDIKTRIREVSERNVRYKIDIVTAKPTRPTVDSLRLSALHKKASELIGTEGKVKDVVKMVMEQDKLSNRQLKLVSIVGMGGLGKTTLANAVYKKLKSQFDCQAFVSVSLNPKLDQVFKSMLHQLDNKRYNNINGEIWDETELINELRSLLNNKRYIIVVDDIWNKSAWANIFRALNKCGRGSRIIITTRILDVAEQTDIVYKLKPLSPVDSRKLFYLRIFGTENRCLPTKELDKESENILRKCGGVPLAIITISSMLASKKETENTVEYWAKVCESMGSGLENTSSDVIDMRRILSVSYHDLPLHLRTCFLYLSLYPEDYEIITHDVIWKWIGEGFVLEKQDMFEAGEDYVRELINRSLILPRFDKRTKASSFQIHDMVLDLITFLSNEQHFLTKLGDQEPEHLPNKIRRLSLQSSNQEGGKRLENRNYSHVRSLSVFPGDFNILHEISRFPVLRELDLTEAQVGNHHFKDICNLFHLRYLRLPRTGISEIPKEIGNLKFLQVLDIHGSSNNNNVTGLPSTFAQLRQLVYLRFCVLRQGVEDLQILGNLPRLSHLSITVKETTQSREKGLLVIGNVYPFLCLTKFEIYDNYMAVMFAEGAMQQLRTLKFSVRESMDQFGGSGFGLENLSSLEHVVVDIVVSGAKPEEAEAAEAEIQKAIDINPNKPELKFEKRIILRMNIKKREEKTKTFGAVSRIHGVQTISFDDDLGKLTVTGMVEPATIIKKLKKCSIQAQPWEVRAAPTVCVEEAAPGSNNSTLRRLILKVWGPICCLPAAACARFSSKHDLTNTSRTTETVTTSH